MFTLHRHLRGVLLVLTALLVGAGAELNLWLAAPQPPQPVGQVVLRLVPTSTEAVCAGEDSLLVGGDVSFSVKTPKEAGYALAVSSIACASGKSPAGLLVFRSKDLVGFGDYAGLRFQSRGPPRGA